MPRVRSTESARKLAACAALFLALFFLLQYLYQGSRGTWVESLLIDRMTVAPSAALIGWFAPREGVSARGHQLVSPHVTLSVLNGCEGTEVMLLLAAAMLAFGTGWRHKLLGIVLGGGLVYLLNQARIAGIYYCLRIEPALFEAVHGYVAPTFIVAAAAMFFLYWVSRVAQRQAD